MTRLSLNDLLPDTDYSVSIRAVAGDKVSGWSKKLDFTTISDEVKPDVPTNVTWVVAGDSFHAEWDAVRTNVEGDNITISRYEIELFANTLTRYVSVPANTADPLLTKVKYDLTFESNLVLFIQPQPTVRFRVRAVDNKDLASDWSAPALIATNPPPAAPASLNGTVAIDTVALSWPAVDEDDVVAYSLYVGPTADFVITEQKRIYTGDALAFAYTTTTYGPSYYKVVAVDKFNQISLVPTTSVALSPVSPFVIDTDAPNIPTITSLVLTNNTNGVGASALANWTITGDISDLNGFYIRYRKVGDTPYRTATFDKDSRSGTINLETAYTNYEFQIAAYDFMANKSAWGSTATGNAPANANPSNVSGLAATPGKDSITYNWTAIADADLKNYEVTVSTSSTFASGNFTYLTGTANSLTVGGLNPSTTYYARVRALDVAGLASAAWSATNTTATTAFPFTPLSDGQAPGSSPTPTVYGGIGFIGVSWAPVTTNALGNPQTDLVAYEVHVSTVSGFTPNAASKAAEIYGTTVNLERGGSNYILQYGENYYVKIIAKDRDNAAAASAQAGPVTPVKVGSADSTLTAANVGAEAAGAIGTHYTNTIVPALAGKATPADIDTKITTFSTGPIITGLQTAVNNPPGAVNLFKKSRTFVGPEYTQLVAGVTVGSLVTPGPFIAADGSFPNVGAIRITSGASGMNMRVREVRQTGQHTLSFWYKRAGATDNGFGVDICDGIPTPTGTLTATSVWQKYEGTANVPAVNNTYNFVDFGSGAATDILIYQPMLETGSRASAYKASPEEIAVDISTTAANSANGVTKVYNSTTVPTGTTDGSRVYVLGDTYFVRGDAGNPNRITGQYEYTASNTWTARTLSHQVISSIDVGNMTIIGQLSAANINATGLTIQQSQVPNLTTDLSARPLATTVNSQISTAESNATTAGSSAAQVALKTLWGGSPTATTIQGGVIATNTILATKIAIADFLNYIADPYFEQTNNPNGLGAGTRYASNAAGVPTGAPYSNVWGFNGVTAPFDINTNYQIPVKPGEEFYMEAWAANSGGSTSTALGALVVSTDKTQQGYVYATGANNGVGVTSTWTKMFGTFTIPATIGGKPVGFIQPWLRPANTIGWFYTGWVVRRKNGAELIVDGAITANAVASDVFKGKTFVVDTGGAIQSVGYNGTAGFQISNTGINIRSGTVNANTLVAGTGIVNNLVIETGGAIRSGDYNGAGGVFDAAATTGFYFGRDGLRIGTGGVVSADAIRTGNLGGPAGVNSVLNIAANTSIVMNGGYLKSNTYTGTTQATNPSGAGFYLGNDGIRVDQGMISAAALTSSALTTQKITLSGTASIESSTWAASGTGFRLDASGLQIPAGSIQAASLNIQPNAANLIAVEYADFEMNNYSGKFSTLGNNVSISTTQARFNTQSLKVVGTNNASGYVYFGGTTDATQANGRVMNRGQATTYIVSWYAYLESGAAVTLTPKLRYGGSTDFTGTGQTISSTGSWQRFSTTIAVTGSPRDNLGFYWTTGAHTSTLYIDGVQIEEKLAGSNAPSTYTVPGYTSIDAGQIRTGSLASTFYETTSAGYIPAWSINMGGYAVFSGAYIYGNVVVGQNSADTTAMISSGNYSPGTAGWRLFAQNGYAEFNSVTLRGNLIGTASSVIGGGTFRTDGVAAAGNPSTGLVMDSNGLRGYNSNEEVLNVAQNGRITLGNGTTKGFIRGGGSTATTFTTAASANVGFYIGSDGLFLGNNATIKGGNIDGVTMTSTTITGATITGTTSITGATIKTSSGGARTEINTSAGIAFYGDGGTNSPVAGGVDPSSTFVGSGYYAGVLKVHAPSGSYEGPGALPQRPAIYLVSQPVQVGGSYVSVDDGELRPLEGILTSAQISGGVVTGNTLFARSQTGSGEVDARVGASGQILRLGSTRKIKREISPMRIDQAKSVLGIESVTFKRRPDANFPDEPIDETVYPGFIAEQAHEAGADLWVTYDTNGEPDGFRYSNMSAAHNMILREHEDKISELEETVRKLEALVNNLVLDK